MQNVHVSYEYSQRGKQELLFAVSLAYRLNATLFVWIRGDTRASALISKMTGQDAQAIEATQIKDRVRLMTRRFGAEITTRYCVGTPALNARDTESVLVGDAGVLAAPGLALIYPMGEASLEARGESEVCLPFGNGDGDAEAGRSLIGFAATLNLPVLLYHTTWRKPGVSDAAPAVAHMMPSAIGVAETLEAEARQVGIGCRTIVQTAPSIAEGVARIALRERCSLIALSRGTHVGRGSYVDGILARTTVPVFVAARGV